MKKFLVLVLVLALSLGLTSVAFAAYDDTNPIPSTNTPADAQPFTAPLQSGELEDTVTNADNGVGNANNSGVGTANLNPANGIDPSEVIKSKQMLGTDFLTPGDPDATPKTQNTHGSYQNNTNSCASCHQTHTGAAKDLLIKTGVYNTCTACHDGTLGFYNVFTESTAGTFGGTVGGNSSVHLANDSVQVMVAPGYNDNGVTNRIPEDEFDCASCHAPHGSYSDRLLHYSPNGMADIAIEKKGNKVNGNVVSLAADFELNKKTALADGASFVIYKGTADSLDAYPDQNGQTFTTVTGIDGTTQVIVLLTRAKGAVATDWKWDNNPWVAGFEHAMNNSGAPTGILKVAYYTEFKTSGGARINEFETTVGSNPNANFAADGDYDAAKLDVIYGKGYATGNLDVVATAGIARAYVVKFDFLPADVNPDFGGIAITKVETESYDDQGKGKAISLYCGACHTDYMTHSNNVIGDGVFRHSTDTDRFNCLKCHFAHGTDVTVMKDARDRDLADLAPDGETDTNYTAAVSYLTDKNPSSALKRYTNMSVCWKCHSAVEGKSSKLMNNSQYWTDYNTNPYGGNTSVDGYQADWLHNAWEN